MQIDEKTIRMYVDGELDHVAAEQLERAMIEDAALASRVAFERRLREKAGAAFETDDTLRAPGDMAARIRAAMACEADLPECADREPEKPAALRRNLAGRIFGPARINYLAVAACLAIVAGAMLFGILGEPLHWWEIGESSDDLMSVAVEQAQGEHARCAHDPKSLVATMEYLDPDAIHRNLDARLGAPTPLFDLRSVGYELVGASQCRLPPMEERSIHVLYRHQSKTRFVSVFIQPEQGQFPVEPGFACDARPQSRVINDGDLVYLVVSCNYGDHHAAAEAIERQLHLR